MPHGAVRRLHTCAPLHTSAVRRMLHSALIQQPLDAATHALQAPKVPGQSVRLRGSTLKVWDAAALMAQRPLLVVHDGELPPRFGWACACGVGYLARPSKPVRHSKTLPAAATAVFVHFCLHPHIQCALMLHLASAVLKHMQLEDGLLFLWRIADDATIITVRAMLGLACAAAGGGHGCEVANSMDEAKGPNEESACQSHTCLHICTLTTRPPPHPTV